MGSLGLWVDCCLLPSVVPPFPQREEIGIGFKGNGSTYQAYKPPEPPPVD